MNHQYLDEGQTLVLSIPLACALGDKQSIVMRRVHWWITHNETEEKTETHYRDGKWWTYNPYKKWAARDFRMWSEKTVERIFTELEALSLLISTDEYNQWDNDHTKWYTVDYEAYQAFVELWIECGEPIVNGGKRTPEYQAFMDRWVLWQAQRYAPPANSTEESPEEPENPPRQLDEVATSTCRGMDDNLTDSEDDKLTPALPVLTGGNSGLKTALPIPTDLARLDVVDETPEPEVVAVRPVDTEEAKAPATGKIYNTPEGPKTEAEYKVWSRQIMESGQKADGIQRQAEADENAAIAWFVRVMRSKCGNKGVTLSTLNKSSQSAFYSPCYYYDKNSRRVTAPALPELYLTEPLFVTWAEELLEQKSTPILNKGARPKTAQCVRWLKDNIGLFFQYRDNGGKMPEPQQAPAKKKLLPTELPEVIVK